MIFNQQQYMGASIRSFNASLGWGGSTSNLDVNLVCDTTRYAADNFFRGESFNPVEVGLPSYFKFSGFNDDELNLSVPTGDFVQWSFGGIVKSYKQDNSIGGSPLFSVSVSDPREILAGTQLILDDYFGSVSGIPNILNVFGAVEDILQLNTADGNFGGMQRNDTGTPWYIIKDAIHYMSSGMMSEHYGTFLKQKNYKYTVNFSDFPANLHNGYRVAHSDSMNLLDYISDVCQAASHDFFVTLAPIYNIAGGLALDENLLPINEIKINTVSRSYLPQPNAIINFIANTSGATVKNIGLEFRNSTNAKFLLGGNINTMYMSYGSGFKHVSGLASQPVMYFNEGIDYKFDPIHQFIGVNPNGNLIPEFRPENDNWIGEEQKADSNIYIDTTNVNSDTYAGSVYITTIDELRAIQTSQEDWESYLLFASKFKYYPIAQEDVDWITKKKTGIFVDCVEIYKGLDAENIPLSVQGGVVVRNTKVVYGTKIPIGYGHTRDPFSKLPFGKLDSAIKTSNDSVLASYPADIVAIIKYPPGNSFSSPYSRPLPNSTTDLASLSAVPNYTLNIITDVIECGDSLINNNKINTRVVYYQRYAMYPVDKYGYTPLIIGDNKPSERISNDGHLPNEVKVTKKWSENWGLVPYRHTKVLNPHYRKYGILKLRGGADDSSMMSAITNVVAFKYQDAQKAIKMARNAIYIDEVANSRITEFYNFLKQFADNYGRKYIIDMPRMRMSHDLTNSGIITQYAPADAGYLTIGEFQQAVDKGFLPNDYLQLTQEDGRLLPYVVYPDAKLFELQSLNTNDVVYTYNYDGSINTAFIKCTIDNEFTYVDRYGPLELSYPKAVITLPSMIVYKEDNDYSYKGNPTFPHLQKIRKIVNNKPQNVGEDNTFEYDGPVAIPPQFVALAIENKTISYGPWYNIGATGQIEYERDESLVPWIYGSYSGMDDAARTKISEVALQQQDESGSIEFPGMPTISLGSQLEWLSNGSTFVGPYITDISVDFGEAGIKTNYKMQTWTPKFGKLAKQYEEDVKRTGLRNAKEARKSRAKREANHTVDEVSKAAVKTVISNTVRKLVPKSKQNNSSHHILAGQSIVRDTGNKYDFNTVVVTQPVYNTKSQIIDNYSDKAIISLDALIRPYSTYINHSGNLAHYEQHNSGYMQFINGVHDLSFDAFVFKQGHDIAAVTSEEEMPNNGISNDRDSYSANKNYRSLGFLHPTNFVGYGRNINGKPVPNANSYEYLNGNYTLSSSGNENSDVYADNYLKRSDMWKVGPLDTRWDDKKKMWVAGSTLVEGYMVEDLLPAQGRFSSVPYTSGLMVLCGGTYAGAENPKIWDRADASGYYSSGYYSGVAPSGAFTYYPDSGLRWHSSGEYYSSLAGPVASGGNPNLFVLLINRSTQISATSGTYIIAAPMPNGDYRPIWVDCETSEREGIE